MSISSANPASGPQKVETPNEGISASSAGKRKHGCISGLLARKPNKAKAKTLCKQWFKEPMNVVLFVWLCVVIVCAVPFFISLTGLLDGILHKQQSLIDLSFEVPNQILNVLFTLLCIYVHPNRFYHLFLLCRWRPEDIMILRKEYCKDGTCKPNERILMMIVVVLLHVNCFGQYALCGLNLGLRKSDRPAAALAVCLVVSVAAPVTAVIIMNHSSLGRDHEPLQPEAEGQNHTIVDVDCTTRQQLTERRLAFASRKEPKRVEENPEWAGGLLDLCDDKSAASLSLFCCVCAFGWNMERLGLGNMYVHIATFLLICTSPVWLFYLASARIENEGFSRAIQLVGALLSVLGLLHGGIWRIKMRKQYNLPPNDACCANPALADCASWIFCCWCSLAQELRTANYYDIVEDAVSFPQKDGGLVPRADARSQLQHNHAVPIDCSGDQTSANEKTSSSVVDKVMTVPAIPPIE